MKATKTGLLKGRKGQSRIHVEITGRNEDTKYKKETPNKRHHESIREPVRSIEGETGVNCRMIKKEDTG